MVKHTQTIRQQFNNELFEFVLPFGKLALKGLRILSNIDDGVFSCSKLEGVKYFQS